MDEWDGVGSPPKEDRERRGAGGHLWTGSCPFLGGERVLLRLIVPVPPALADYRTQAREQAHAHAQSKYLVARLVLASRAHPLSLSLPSRAVPPPQSLPYPGGRRSNVRIDGRKWERREGAGASEAEADAGAQIEGGIAVHFRRARWRCKSRVGRWLGTAPTLFSQGTTTTTTTTDRRAC